MKWSQIKKQVEGNFAPAVAGRVSLHMTRYRKSHDQLGEGWITIDKERVLSMGTAGYLVRQYRLAQTLRAEYSASNLPPTAENDADQMVRANGDLPSWEFTNGLKEYLNLSIDAAVNADNPIIRAVAMLDRRFGKRRLTNFDASNEHLFVQQLHRFRCEAEGIDNRVV